MNDSRSADCTCGYERRGPFMATFDQDSYTKMVVKTKRYYVDHTSGMACEEGPSAFVIERSEFYLHRDSPSWSVRFSQLKACFPDYTKSTIRGPCTVLHARDAVKFLQACRKYSLMPHRDVSPLNDFVHNNYLYGINKKIEFSETDSSDSLIVNGLYDKEDALIEKVRIGDANCTELKKILRKTCFHENVISYLGSERDSEYDCYAFEVAGDTLENHLKRHPYKEMDESSLKIIEGFVHGVKHLHDRGLVHMNINPRNVFVNDSTTVKICGMSQCKRKADEPGMPSSKADAVKQMQYWKQLKPVEVSNAKRKNRDPSNERGICYSTAHEGFLRSFHHTMKKFVLFWTP